MYSYYAGDNERNDYDKINGDKNKKDVEETKLRHAPSIDYNHQVMKRKHTSQLELEKAKREAEQLLNEGDAQKIMDEKFIFKKQSVSLFRIYCHLFEPIDWLFVFLAIIGSIGSGVSMPLMSYLTSDVYSDVGNTSERMDTQDEIALMEEIIEDTMDSQIKKMLISGAVSFVCYFFSVCFWSLIGNRCCYNMKKNISLPYYLKNKVGSMRIMLSNLPRKYKHN